MKNKILQRLLIVAVLAIAGNSFAATINIGAVGSSASTGFYVKEDGSFNLTGKIRVGTFSKTQAELQTIIDGWGAANKGPSLSNWTALNSFFTEVGTGGLNGTAVSGWNFNSSTGAVGGTSSSVDTTIVPANAQLYVWASTISTFTAADFKTDGSTQWALVTDAVDWLAPSSGTKSLNLQLIDPAGVLIGTDMSSLSSNNVRMVATIPEPSSSLLAILGLVTLAMRKRRS
jgi:hypothetical protein